VVAGIRIIPDIIIGVKVDPDWLGTVESSGLLRKPYHCGIIVWNAYNREE